MSQRIKVLHIIKSLGRGGAEMLLPETLFLHDLSIFEFDYIYFLPWKDQMVEEIQAKGGMVTCVAAKSNIQLIFKIPAIAKYVQDQNIQVIHAHLPWAGILARIVGKLTGVPVLYTEHNKQERYHWATRWMNIGTMNLLTRVIAVSEDVACSIYKNKPHLTVPLQTIVNGVNTEKFDRRNYSGDTVRARLNIPRNAPIIGTIAVFRFQKRLDLWMELAAKILEQAKDVHFIIVGDGPLKAELIGKRDAMGLGSSIHMVGLQSEVRPYLAAFDVYMMSSSFEGLPIALLEAMAMECPVIATDAGGIKEVIRHEVDGLICCVDEPEKLIGYAVSLLENYQQCQRLGESGRKRVVDSFSLDRMVKELEEVYSEIGVLR